MTAVTPFSTDLRIPRGVWDGMGPLAQATATRAAEQRAVLSGVPLLLQLGETLPAVQANGLGVTVLHEDADNSVSVGLIDLPQLDDAVQGPPKSESARHTPYASICTRCTPTHPSPS
jgi:hypothetical protein